MKIVKTILNYPTPFNISYLWNGGSLLGLLFTRQTFTGFFLTLLHTNTEKAFVELQLRLNNQSYGYLFHFAHITGASFLFLFLYAHMFRRIVIGSKNLRSTWSLGFALLLFSILTAFLGYVLPFSNIRLWAATVITNLLRVVPKTGATIVTWLWGGFFISSSALKLFFSLHFLLPFIMFLLILLHLLSLHTKGSTNPLGIFSIRHLIPFKYFLVKDALNVVIFLPLLMISLLLPHILIEADAFTPSNLTKRPLHITPEWYFLWAYAILRRVPNKLGGVSALVVSLILLGAPKTSIKIHYSSKKEWIFSFSTLLLGIFLTWAGAQGVEEPFTFIGILATSGIIITLSITL